MAADTSLVVASFASWHEKNDAASRTLNEGLCLIEHCALETYSVLTQLLPPYRAGGAVVRYFLAASFPQAPLRLSPSAWRSFLSGWFPATAAQRRSMSATAYACA